jgi:hypothetical protein
MKEEAGEFPIKRLLTVDTGARGGLSSCSVVRIQQDRGSTHPEKPSSRAPLRSLGARGPFISKNPRSQ